MIAAGYFDKGNTAIAGILNIYHPDYKQYSPGKFLILKKLEYALSHDMMFYYTGYISTESTRFDYKIFPDAKAVEVLLPVEQQWLPYHLLNKDFLAAYYTRFLLTSKEALYSINKYARLQNDYFNYPNFFCNAGEGFCF